jgi:CBS domain-containing protein
MHAITLKDVMTPTPVCVDASASLGTARQLLETHDIHHLPVMINGSVEGILSARDMKFAALPGHYGTADEQLTVADVCQSKAFVADCDYQVSSIVRIMADQHISEVLVLANGELAGIFTEADCCKLLAAMLNPSPDL